MLILKRFFPHAVLLSLPALALLSAGAHASPIQGSDSCSSAQPIFGFGNFGFDTTASTTDGLADVACDVGGNQQIEADVWFLWNAGASGTIGIATCTAGLDTKLAVYASQTCPPSLPLDCDDDTCGVGSLVTFVAVAGMDYLIRLGTPNPVTPGGVGQFAIAQLGPANDDCMCAESISGEGFFAFDTNLATTDGPPTPGCAGGQIDDDVWYRWTAPQAGTFRVRTCGGSADDTAIAAYKTGRCPALAAPPLACDDNACGPQSSITLFVDEPGDLFLLRIGNPASFSGASGSFEITSSYPVGGEFQALRVQALGQATVTLQGTQLLVDNIGSSGQDGVAIQLPPGTGCYSAAIPPFDPDLNVTGAFLETRTYGRSSGLNRLVNLTRVEDAGGLVDIFTDMGSFGVSGLSTTRTNFCGDVTTLTASVGGGSRNFSGQSRGLTECGLTNTPSSNPNQWWTGEDPTGLGLLGTPLFGEGDRVEFVATDGFSLDEYSEVVFTAKDLSSFTIKTLVPLPMGAGSAPGPVITEVVSGPLAGDQPQWIELQNQSAAPMDLSDFTLGVFEDGSPLLSGATSSAFSSAILAPGQIFVLALESASNTDCDPMSMITCFELVYGFAPDAYDAPRVDGNDAIALFRGTATGDASDAPLVDLYGEIGVDGSGETWEYADSYALRNTVYPSPDFGPQEWALPNPGVLDADMGSDAARVLALTGPGAVGPCCSGGNQGTPYCVSVPNSTGQAATIVGSGSNCVAINDFTLDSTNLPSTFGLYFMGDTQVSVPFGDGFRCVAGNVFRFQPPLMVNAGAVERTLDLENRPAEGNVLPGSTWNFQLWYRDPMGAGGLFNLSGGLEVLFR